MQSHLKFSATTNLTTVETKKGLLYSLAVRIFPLMSLVSRFRTICKIKTRFLSGAEKLALELFETQQK